MAELELLYYIIRTFDYERASAKVSLFHDAEISGWKPTSGVCQPAQDSAAGQGTA